MTAPQPEEGWYPTADRPGFERRWDGARWTGEIRYAGEPRPEQPAPAKGSNKKALLIAGGLVAVLAVLLGLGMATKGGGNDRDAAIDATSSAHESSATASDIGHVGVACSSAVASKFGKSAQLVDYTTVDSGDDTFETTGSADVNPGPPEQPHRYKITCSTTQSGTNFTSDITSADEVPYPAPDTSDDDEAERALDRAADRARYQASLAPVNAELQCEEMVTKQLKSPSTADFPDKHMTRPFGTGYEVRGVVDSQNGFGATVRSYFGCTSVPDGKGQYTVTVTELFTP